MRRLNVVLALCSLTVAQPAMAQLTAAERKGIEDSLYVGNMGLGDLGFERKPFKDPHRMPVIDSSLDNVMGCADFLMAWHASASTGTLGSLLSHAVTYGFGDPQVTLGPEAQPPPFENPQVPAGLRLVVSSLVAQIQSCDAEIRTSLSKLSPAEQRELVESLPQWAVEEPKVQFSFVKTPQSPQARILSLLDRVDFPRMRAAALRLAEAVDTAVTDLRKGSYALSGKMKLTVGGLPIVLAGTESDVHEDTDARLTIDLGGDDVYKGRHGAGVGYSSVLIDLGGDDAYDVKDLSVGAAELGVGIAVDTAGNDTFRGQSLCFGCGLGGIGLFEKRGGHDFYQAVSLAEGYGQFGIGICLDTAGNDRYDLKLYGQGAARTQGVGWLVDRAGSDVYRAGGLSMNEPLFTGVSYSFAQGFGSGYREDTGGLSGGVGLLTDLGGDDCYWGDTYMQAASYWFAVGTLYDAAGNDTYSGYHYCQSSAMHMCGAYLFDLAGDDAYVTKYGASLAIGHDYGVAFMLDRAGNDIYAARDGTPGVGNANGLGVFVDGDGIDRYDGPPGQGNPARNTGSLGVFVDLGGQDKYRTGLADGEATVSSTWGTAYDVASPASGPGESAAQRPAPKPGSQAKPSDAEMEAVYKKATQWGVGSAQAEVADNIDKLVAIGVPALEWMLEKHLATADRLQQRAFVEVVKALGPEGSAALGPKALRGTKAEKKILVAIALDANLKDFGAILAPMLDDPDLQEVAAKAAGPLKATACVDALTRLCLSPNRLLARWSMVSLALIADPASFATGVAMLKNSDLPTRQAALQLLATVPAQAMETAKGLADDADEHTARMGLHLYGAVGTTEALKAAAGFLLDPRPGLRIEALLVLNGRCPPEFSGAFRSLSKDPFDLVRAVAARVKPNP